jgi:hypothetical protein
MLAEGMLSNLTTLRRASGIVAANSISSPGGLPGGVGGGSSRTVNNTVNVSTRATSPAAIARAVDNRLAAAFGTF